MDERFTELAKGAYDAYGETTDYKNYQGLPMPEWNALTDKIRAAWVAASKYVYDQTINQKNPPAMEAPDHR